MTSMKTVGGIKDDSLNLNDDQVVIDKSMKILSEKGSIMDIHSNAITAVRIIKKDAHNESIGKKSTSPRRETFGGKKWTNKKVQPFSITSFEDSGGEKQTKTTKDTG
jgi:hypothetical protein